MKKLSYEDHMEIGRKLHRMRKELMELWDRVRQNKKDDGIFRKPVTALDHLRAELDEKYGALYPEFKKQNPECDPHPYYFRDTTDHRS